MPCRLSKGGALTWCLPTLAEGVIRALAMQAVPLNLSQLYGTAITSFSRKTLTSIETGQYGRESLTRCFLKLSIRFMYSC